MAHRHVGDFGQTLHIDTPDVDYTGQSAIVICVIKPTGDHVEWVPTSFNAVGRWVEYIFQDGDLTRPGNYEISVKFTFGGASEVVTDSFMLEVADTPC